MAPQHWLAPILRAAGPGTPTLVLCRAAPSVALVRRFVATNGGSLGLDVITPHGLAHQVAPPADPSVESPLPTGGLWDRLQGRPNLERGLLTHLDRVQLLGLRDDPDFSVLPVGEVKPTPASSALLALVELAQRRGADLDAERRYAHVFAVGFGTEDGSPEAHVPNLSGTPDLDSALLKALGAVRLTGPVKQRGAVPVPVAAAPDVVAEARGVAAVVERHVVAGGDLNGVLVLTPNRQDADRIRAALTRSGLASTDDESRPLREHGLCALVSAILPWFGTETEPILTAEELRRLLHSRLLRQTWSAKALAAVGRDLHKSLQQAGLQATAPDDMAVAEDPDPATDDVETANEDMSDKRTAREAAAAEVKQIAERLFLSRSQAASTLVACRISRAPLSRWLNALKRLTAEPVNPKEFESTKRPRRSAHVLLARLEWLQKCRNPQAPTLGNLLDFLNGFGIRTFANGGPDAIAMAIVSALGDAKQELATEQVLEDALAGVAASGRLDQGVTLLPYAGYDGRGCDLLILTGLHAKGIGRAPTPDPFFPTATLFKLGVRQGELWLDAMEGQVCAAVRRAGTVRGFNAERDETGRQSAPYLNLTCEPARLPGAAITLARDEGEKLGSYGLAASNRESEDLHALQVVDGAVPKNSPFGQGSEADVLALQATLEWLRNGAAQEDYLPPNRTDITDLRDVLRLLHVAHPTWAQPWLGVASAEAAAHLPTDTNLSATSGLEPLTHCLYQAFAKVRLRLREADEAGEEPDAREIGSVLHTALENVGKRDEWRVPKGGKDTAVEVLTTILQEEVRKSFAALPTADSAALQLANAQAATRWSEHMRAWVHARVEELDPDAGPVKAGMDAVASATASTGLDTHVMALLDLQPKVWNPAERPVVVRRWLAAAVAALSADEDPWTREIAELAMNKTSAKSAPDRLLEVCGDATTRAGLDELLPVYREAFAEASAAHGPTLETLPEWVFGHHRGDTSRPQRFLNLPGVPPLQVNGAIDRLRVTGDATRALFDVVDYKTWGGSAKDRAKKGLTARTLPQVGFYALVVRQALEEKWLTPNAEQVDLQAGFDFLRKAKANEGVFRCTEDELKLQELAAHLGQLLRHAQSGSYPLSPHPDTCPKTQRHGHDYCTFASLCRFRSHSEMSMADADDDDTDDGQEDA